MIKSFKNKGTEDIFNGNNTKDGRKICPQSIWKIALRKLDQIDSTNNLNDLKIPLGNNLELLKGDKQGKYSIRINDQYRIIFSWDKGEAVELEIVDYH